MTLIRKLQARLARVRQEPPYRQRQFWLAWGTVALMVVTAVGAPIVEFLLVCARLNLKPEPGF